MRGRHRFSGRSTPRTTWAGAFLLATLALSVWLAYEAAFAARSHREAAEAAVRDYARVAAWQYSRRAGEELDNFLGTLFDEVPRRARATLPPPREVQRDLDDALQRAGCNCPGLESPALMFRLDLRTMAVASAGDHVAPPVRRIIADTLASAATADRARHGILLVPAGRVLPVETTLAYALVTDSLGPAAAYVVGFDARAFGALFQRWYEHAGLLPPVITDGLPNDSLVQVAVRSRPGLTLYESAHHFQDQQLAADTMRPAHGQLVVTAAIPSAAVSRLIIGGMPRSRLPLILGLLMLTLGVGLAAVLQLQRERQLARLREDFISGVSHELRTPLAQIRMFAELQESGKLRTAEDQKRAVSVINREAQRLTHLVDNILRFARRRSTSERTAARELINVAELVTELLEGFRSVASSGRMHLHARIDDTVQVVANRAALHHVLVNLLDNATKYGPAGQTIEVSAGTADGRTWIAVEDGGPGVPQADRTRIWEPYVRLQRDIEARVPGTGIGLAVVAEQVAASGGRVYVEDGASGGARFVVELDAAGPAGSLVEPDAREEAFA